MIDLSAGESRGREKRVRETWRRKWVEEDIRVLKMKVDGMTCDHCVTAVTRVVSRAAGVERVRGVDLKRGEVELEGAPDIGALVRALADEGYAARLLE